MDRKERNFGHASSVNIDFFVFFSDVHIATCTQKSGLALFKCWKKCISLRLDKCMNIHETINMNIYMNMNIETNIHINIQVT